METVEKVVESIERALKELKILREFDKVSGSWRTSALEVKAGELEDWILTALRNPEIRSQYQRRLESATFDLSYLVRQLELEQQDD